MKTKDTVEDHIEQYNTTSLLLKEEQEGKAN